MNKITCTIAVTLLLVSTRLFAQSEIIPLAVGNYWKFVNKQGETEYARVLAMLNIDGNVWFKYRELSDEDIFIVRNTSKGQVELDADTNKPVVVFKYPVKKETTYKQFGNLTKVSPKQTVTVPAGTFETYLYNFSVADPDNQIWMWVAPGIGPIKSAINDDVFELVEYKIE